MKRNYYASKNKPEKKIINKLRLVEPYISTAYNIQLYTKYYMHAL